MIRKVFRLLFVISIGAVPASSQWQATNIPMMGPLVDATEFQGQIYLFPEYGSIMRLKGPSSIWENSLQAFEGVPIYSKGDGYLYIADRRGVLKTSNGFSWETISNPTGTTYLHVNKQQMLRIEDMQRVYISSDGGYTWILRDDLNDIGEHLLMAALKDSVVIVSATLRQQQRNSFKISTDSAKTWSIIPQSDIFPGGPITALSANDRYFFISTDSGLFRSGDAVTWANVLDSLGGRKVVLGDHPDFDGSNISIITTAGYAVSSNNGDSWRILGGDLPSAGLSFTKIVYVDSGWIALSEYSGVFFHGDINEPWIQMNKGLSNLPIDHFLEFDTTLLAHSPFNSDLYRSVDSGSSWYTNSGSICTCWSEGGMAASRDAIYWVWGTNGGTAVHMSSDGGLTWTVMHQFAPAQGVELLCVADSTLIGRAQDRISISRDRGTTWIDSILVFSGESVRSSRVCGCKIYLGTSTGSVWYSPDQGTTWSILSHGVIDSSVEVLATIPGGIVAATAGQGIFVSMDSGTTWNPRNEGIKDLRILSLTTEGRSLFISTMNGREYTSNDYGYHWEDITCDLEGKMVIQLYAWKGYLFAGTDACGVWRCRLNEVTNSIEQPLKRKFPSVFSLFQNYPNPFNSSTRISFALPVKGQVQLVLYDILGREAARIINEPMPAGYHEIVFDASSYSTGVYYYTLTCGRWKRTAKMILLR